MLLPEFQQSLTRRGGCSCTAKRRELSKRIRKLLRAFQRRRQNQRLNGILQDFQGLGRLDAVFRDPFVAVQQHVNKLPQRRILQHAWLTSFDLTDPYSYRHVSFADVRRFELSELSLVLENIPNGKSGDEEGMVLKKAWCWKCSSLVSLSSHAVGVCRPSPRQAQRPSFCDLGISVLS